MREALRSAQEDGIVFIDEIDKIVTPHGALRHGEGHARVDAAAVWLLGCGLFVTGVAVLGSLGFPCVALVCYYRPSCAPATTNRQHCTLFTQNNDHPTRCQPNRHGSLQ